MARDEHIGEILTANIAFTPETGQLGFQQSTAQRVSEHLKSVLNSTVSSLKKDEIAHLGIPDSSLPVSIISTESMHCRGFTTWFSENGALCTVAVETQEELSVDHIKYSFIKRYEGMRLEYTIEQKTGDEYPAVRLTVRNTQLDSESKPALLTIDLYENHVQGITIPDGTVNQLKGILPDLDLTKLRHDRVYRQQILEFLRNQLFISE